MDAIWVQFPGWHGPTQFAFVDECMWFSEAHGHMVRVKVLGTSAGKFVHITGGSIQIQADETTALDALKVVIAYAEAHPDAVPPNVIHSNTENT